MSYPTGMGAATGNHYNNVAAQMQAYLNHSHSQPSLQPAGGHFHQHHHSHGPAFASHAYGNHGSYFGIDPVIGSDVGEFSRAFMRNLLR
jgi:hypothetical protein